MLKIKYGRIEQYNNNSRTDPGSIAQLISRTFQFYELDGTKPRSMWYTAYNAFAFITYRIFFEIQLHILYVIRQKRLGIRPNKICSRD